MAKYHTSEDGLLRECKAEKGKCRLGAHFEADNLDEAVNKAADAAYEKVLKANSPQPEVYVHPQGKRIEVNPNGSLIVTKDGRPATSGATLEELRSGRGAWKRDDKAQSQPVSTEDGTRLLKDYEDTQNAVEDARGENRALGLRIKAWDSLHGAEEGRAYYHDYSIGPGKHQGVNPDGKTFFERSDEQKQLMAEASQKIKDANRAAEEAQTRVEKAGLGHMLPDDGNVLRVRTQAQKWLLENELKGQFSDGMWENASPHGHWKPWSDAKVIVDPSNIGRNFHAQKDNYQINSAELLDIVGDRMVAEAGEKMKSAYDAKAMAADLKDLRTILKTKRARLTPAEM